MKNVLHDLEQEQIRKESFDFQVGDLVEVHYRIREGDKERIQVFAGTVIARKHGGVREAFTVRRIVAGEGVERVFPLHSPRIAEVRVRRHGRVRRAKLYYLRDRVGKATRVKERRVNPVASGKGAKAAKAAKGASTPDSAAAEPVEVERQES